MHVRQLELDEALAKTHEAHIATGRSSTASIHVRCLLQLVASSKAHEVLIVRFFFGIDINDEAVTGDRDVVDGRHWAGANLQRQWCDVN